MTSADPPPLVGDHWPSPRTGGTLRESVDAGPQVQDPAGSYPPNHGLRIRRKCSMSLVDII